jgi:hypothetical protein
MPVMPKTMPATIPARTRQTTTPKIMNEQMMYEPVEMKGSQVQKNNGH